MPPAADPARGFSPPFQGLWVTGAILGRGGRSAAPQRRSCRPANGGTGLILKEAPGGGGKSGGVILEVSLTVLLALERVQPRPSAPQPSARGQGSEGGGDRTEPDGERVGTHGGRSTEAGSDGVGGRGRRQSKGGSDGCRGSRGGGSGGHGREGGNAGEC